MNKSVLFSGLRAAFRLLDILAQPVCFYLMLANYADGKHAAAIFWVLVLIWCGRMSVVHYAVKYYIESMDERFKNKDDKSDEE